VGSEEPATSALKKINGIERASEDVGLVGFHEANERAKSMNVNESVQKK
jgi:hypothetical protein